RSLSLLLVLAAPAAFGQADVLDANPWIEPPGGTTHLTELGAHRIAYQLRGADPVAMPPGWSGDFTEDVGIAFYPAGTHGGRKAHVLHCPWKQGTGRVSLEYPLVLPRKQPLVLRFGYAMRPDIAAKSDGVTFSAYLLYDDQRHELLREHYTGAAWKDAAFDLTAFGGRRVVVGFQAEPGPANNGSFDFSLLGDPTLTIGKATDTRGRLLRELTRSRAYRRTAGADLRRLANDPARGIVPSTNDEHHTRVHLARHAAGLFYHGTDCQIEYAIPFTAGGLDRIVARVNDGQPFRPCAGGGIWFAPDPKKPNALFPPERAELVKPAAPARGGKGVALTWRYHLGDLSADVTWTFWIDGKALGIAASATGGHVARLWLGQPFNLGPRRSVSIPYQNFAPAYFLRPQNVYVMSTLDWTQSMASRTPGNDAVYVPALDGKRQPLRETGYVAVSPELGEVLPNIPHPPSPYLKQLGDKIVLDIWGGTYDRGAEILRTLKSYGVDHAAVIWHNWQRYGYDVKLPDHLPANPALGGDEAMTRLAAAARQVGYPFSLHENYIDFYPDAPSYDTKDIVLTPQGEFSKAWYHKGTKVQSFALKAGRMLHYAAQNSPVIHRRFGTTAAYLDVHTCVPPWHHVDYDPKTEHAASHHLKVLVHKRLFQYERDVHHGPLFGEGHNHFFWAGLVDGVEAQVSGGEDRELLLDYDLLKIHPQMVNHGMGYYTRWLRTGRATKWGVEAPTPAQLDKYRATTLAYGHAGFVGSQLIYVPQLVWREHNIVQPVQALYGTAKATEVLYGVGGRLVTASAAVPCAKTLDRARVTYDSGLVLHANLRDEPWELRHHRLPQFGFLAEGPGLLAYTALRDGVIADYAENGESLFVDARTHVYRPWEQGRKKVQPSLKSLKDNGDGTLAVTYTWEVGETLDQDYVAFVHFVDPEATESDGICFQDDHTPKPGTSTWQPGKPVIIGPHKVTVPADREEKIYDIVIGLYAPGGPRLAMHGTDAGGRRYLIGRLAVERDGGRVGAVRQLPIREIRREQAALRRRFDERMNLARRAVDFGKVRTDGSFKVYKGDGSLVLLPYPREEKFLVELDVPALVPGRRGDEARVQALDADGKPLGNVLVSANRRWLIFRVGTPKAARYAITFREAK
ncbi:hypothetical protein HQ576_11010, partial [bacterium]|nr:hypothetical protein [bacterium]